MSRWRPPTKKGSPYITPEGITALRAELQHLWKVERPVVTQAVHDAAKNGDRSENGDYIYGKRRLREIDRRVGYLTRRLDELKVIDRHPDNLHRVFFGAYVTLENDQGEHTTYRLVGPDEFDVGKGKISIDSPLAKALIGKALDDEITLNIEGIKTFYVHKIEYI